MKARVVKQKSEVLLLCNDGTICFASPRVLANLLRNFKSPNNFNGDYGRWDTECLDMSLFSGETIAYITDSLELVITSSAPFFPLVEDKLQVNEYLSVPEYAKKHGKTTVIIKKYCREGKIIGASKKGGCWIIPEDAPYPVPPCRQREGVRGPRRKKTS